METIQDRVSVSIGSKEFTNLHLSIQSDVPIGMNFEEYQSELLDKQIKAFGLLNEKLQSAFNKQDAAPKQEAAPAYTPAPSNLGNCKHCGSPNKWSTKKGKPYCSNMCWNKNK